MMCVHDRFFDVAQEAPASVALEWDGGSMSYSELAGRALRIAAGLAASGLRPGDRVVVRLPKGPDQVAANLGVLAAGAAFVPFSVSQPRSRAKNAAAALGASEIVDSRRLATLEGGSRLQCCRESDGTACLLFCDGEEGVVDARKVSHSELSCFVESAALACGLGSQDAILSTTAPDFAPALFDAFAPLSVGARMVLVGEGQRCDLTIQRDIAVQRGVTVLNTTSSLLERFFGDAQAQGRIRAALVLFDRHGPDVGWTAPGHLQLVDLAKCGLPSHAALLGPCACAAHAGSSGRSLDLVSGAVLQCPGMKSALTVDVGSLGTAALRTYAVAQSGASPDRKMALALTSELLGPEVDHSLVFLEELPLDRNGLVDVGAIEELAADGLQEERDVTLTREERAVASVWEDVLCLGEVGKDDNFFELGGDSLAAMRMIAALESLGIQVRLVEFMDEPTVSGVCRSSSRV